jgi:hypothetical protein
MKDCEQSPGVSLLQHGESVRDGLLEIINYLSDGEPIKGEWVLPQWILDNKELFLSNLPDWETLELYTVYHDCGKWAVLETDELGKRHFPNHSQMSYKIFNSLFDNKIASELILRDMDIHLLKSDGVEKFCEGNPHTLTQLLVGLVEIHVNAKSWGGIESVGFKIKWKSLNQRGKKIIEWMNKNKK